jgi:hypothetical protein
MVSDELKTLLLAKKADLIKELNAINILLGHKEVEEKIQNVTTQLETRIFSSAVNNRSTTIKAKSDFETWKEYIFVVMKSIGGKLKSKEIADAILSVNSNTSKERVYSITRDKLAELVKEGRIDSTVGSSRKVGNVYEVIDTL